ncbi:putative glutathione transferase [Helianthus annuus]|uniref:Glutathione transferase n=1 Tax=Helianthus annuus TaxID=4232 RepID=A0A251UEI2_HELAN|nr:uncharacterized protein LOC110868400 [Helianthus annuus]KAF5799302.1 putative glutathione transferase [Helianthus annuus]KAJ0550753.1 putative glutathione transferase [Helianthus annuus]KAJ0557586.1 putative glutathione transferase [Helianthus annuus]KAJ0563720.1 putative glutathione transferase [Helianthus annuus]KAJ0729052.1 putative glutathione transferase [Helianthus annuus]
MATTNIHDSATLTTDAGDKNTTEEGDSVTDDTQRKIRRPERFGLPVQLSERDRILEVLITTQCTKKEPGMVHPGPSKAKRKHRKKAVDAEPVEKNVMHWTSDEELALARAWVEISEDPATGNHYKGTDFWKRVREAFHKLTGREPYRNADSISGKWREMRRKVAAFNVIFNNLSNNRGRTNGASDVDLLIEAHKIYKQDKSHGFTMDKPWQILRKSTKWHLVPLMDVQDIRVKRSKSTLSNDHTSSQVASDAHSQLKLDNSDNEFEMLEEPTPPVDPLPVGRDRAKNKNKGGGSSSTNPDMQAQFESINANIKKLLALAERETDAYDLMVLGMNTDGMSDVDKQIIEKQKNKIRKRFLCALDEDDENEKEDE